MNWGTKEIVPFGATKVAAYEFSGGDAGFFGSSHVIIFNDIGVSILSGPIGKSDPNFSAILSSFKVSNLASVIPAKCD